MGLRSDSVPHLRSWTWSQVNLAGFTAVHLDDQGGAWVDVDSAAAGNPASLKSSEREVRMEKDSCSW